MLGACGCWRSRDRADAGAARRRSDQMPGAAWRHIFRRTRQILSAPGDADQSAACLQRLPAPGDRAVSLLMAEFSEVCDAISAMARCWARHSLSSPVLLLEYARLPC